MTHRNPLITMNSFDLIQLLSKNKELGLSKQNPNSTHFVENKFNTFETKILHNSSNESLKIDQKTITTTGKYKFRKRRSDFFDKNVIS